jgi:putative membrane protein insertion efficiency factor
MTAEGRTAPGPVGRLLILLVRLYQAGLSPYLGGQCRFYPTCSEYFIQAVRAKGALAGAWMGIRRILRCHPFGGSGYDPVE